MAVLPDRVNRLPRLVQWIYSILEADWQPAGHPLEVTLDILELLARGQLRLHLRH